MSVVTERSERTGSAVHALRSPAVLFALGVAIHGIDHLGRGMMASPPSIMVAGTVQLVFVVLAVVAVWQGRQWAPELGAVVALVSVVGFTYAHLLPAWWPAFSDSFVTGARVGVTWFSWVTVIAEIGAELVFAVAAARVVRSRRG